MRFRLIYDGALPADKAGTADVKQAIRRQFHPQLRELWDTHGYLRNVEREKIAADFSRNGYRFIPLLRKRNELACSFDMVLLLRHQPDGMIHGGDLDNRVKTLIDGLRMPGQKSELGASDDGPREGEDPFFCLLEDDELIYELSIRTGQLLAPRRPDQASRDVVALIEVHVMNSNRSEISSWGHGFDFVSAQ